MQQGEAPALPAEEAGHARPPGAHRRRAGASARARGAETGVFRKVDRALVPTMVIGLVWGTALNHADETPAEILAQRVIGPVPARHPPVPGGVATDGVRPPAPRLAGAPAAPRRHGRARGLPAPGAAGPGGARARAARSRSGSSRPEQPDARGDALLHGGRAPESADAIFAKTSGYIRAHPRRAGRVREGGHAPGRDRADRGGDRRSTSRGPPSRPPRRASRSRGRTSNRRGPTS